MLDFFYNAPRLQVVSVFSARFQASFYTLVLVVRVAFTMSMYVELERHFLRWMSGQNAVFAAAGIGALVGCRQSSSNLWCRARFFMVTL